MRKFLLPFMFLPVVINAQINRSATELAKENIQDYITTKLFNGHSYQSISYGELKQRKDSDDPDIAWSMQHKFQITEMQASEDKKLSSQKPYRFMFYLDRKMKVLKAVTFYSD